MARNASPTQITDLEKCVDKLVSFDLDHLVLGQVSKQNGVNVSQYHDELNELHRKISVFNRKLNDIESDYVTRYVNAYKADQYDGWMLAFKGDEKQAAKFTELAQTNPQVAQMMTQLLSNPEMLNALQQNLNNQASSQQVKTQNNQSSTPKESTSNQDNSVENDSSTLYNY